MQAYLDRVGVLDALKTTSTKFNDPNGSNNPNKKKRKRMNKSGTTNTEKRGSRIRGNANPNLVSHCSYGGGKKISTGAKDFSGVSPAAKRRKRRRGLRSLAESEMRMRKKKARWKMICRGVGLLFISAELP